MEKDHINLDEITSRFGDEVLKVLGGPAASIEGGVIAAEPPGSSLNSLSL
jgi:hypothetical protein